MKKNNSKYSEIVQPSPEQKAKQTNKQKRDKICVICIVFINYYVTQSIFKYPLKKMQPSPSARAVILFYSRYYVRILLYGRVSKL